MKTQTVGNITIDRVFENEQPFFGLDHLLPGYTPDILEANADWLKPHFIDPATDQAILGFHSLLVRTPQHNILVDCCVGNDKERPRPFWHRQQFPWMDNLKAQGLGPEDIDYVMCTHLHADHVGWNTRLVDGRWVPTFPNAKYIFARSEYEFWAAEHAKLGADDEPVLYGAFTDSVLPVVEAGRAVMVESDWDLDHSVWFEPAPGHTPGNVVVHVKDGDGHALLVGDAIHTPAQLARPSLSSIFCEDPALSAETRTRLVERVADTSTLFLTAHFPTPCAGRVVSHRDAFRFEV